MKLIGLTGGIGSGKSTVAGLFRTLGIPVYESDLHAKSIMHGDEVVRQKITNLFGVASYTKDMTLNRAWIADQVFNNPALLKQLNEIVHPAVYQDLKGWAAEESHQGAPYLLQESAILFEENLASRMESNILVVAPEEIRIDRVMKRDNVLRDEVIARIKHQWPDTKKIPFSDYVIYNDGARSLIEQVMDIDNMIRIEVRE